MTQQPDPLRTDERLISVHTARSWVEAVVVRGLLESGGIPATELGAGSPSPVPDLAPLLYGIEIHVLQSQADARAQINRRISGQCRTGGDHDGNREDDCRGLLSCAAQLRRSRKRYESCDLLVPSDSMVIAPSRSVR